MPQRSGQLDRAIDCIYDAAVGAVPWTEALRALAVLFDANGANYEVEAPEGGWAVSVGTDPALVPLYLARYVGRHELTTRIKHVEPGTVVTDRSVLPKPDLLRTDFFNEFLRPQGFHALLNVRATRGRDGALTNVCLTRGRRGDDFEAQDMELLRRLAPHLCRAVAIHQRLVEADAMQEALEDALDRVPQAMFLVGGDAHVRRANRAAAAMLATCAGLSIESAEGGALRAALRKDTLELRRVIAAAAPPHGAGVSGRALLVRRPPAAPLVVTVTPLRASAAERVGLRPMPLALVLATDPDTCSRVPGPATLSVLFGLTPTEAAVASTAAQGRGLRGTSTMLGMSYATARVHLHRVFDKVGVHRQAELAAVLSRLGTFVA